MEFIKTSEDILYLIIMLIVFISTIAVFAVVVKMYFQIINDFNAKAGKPSKSFGSLIGNWYRGLTNAVPIEKEQTVLMNHSYDGIRELDNHLPPWWTALFVTTVIWGVIYLGIYHVWDSSPLQESEYALEMDKAQAEAQAYAAKHTANIDENTAKVSLALAPKGKEVWDANCVACHGTAGEGGVGPNLTDDFWIHGDGSIKEVFKVVKNGVPEKGMIPWKNTLKPEQIESVSNYILSLKGTNPTNAKAPQGTQVKAI